MSLYIPNAKIPVSCNKCYEIGLAHRLRDLGGHCPRMDLHYSPDEQSFKGDRRVDCPLIPVPPHGRLIDEADVFSVFDRLAGYLDDDMIFRIKYLIHRDCPTVIPASAREVREND